MFNVIIGKSPNIVVHIFNMNICLFNCGARRCLVFSHPVFSTPVFFTLVFSTLGLLHTRSFSPRFFHPGIFPFRSFTRLVFSTTIFSIPVLSPLGLFPTRFFLPRFFPHRFSHHLRFCPPWVFLLPVFFFDPDFLIIKTCSYSGSLCDFTSS